MRFFTLLLFVSLIFPLYGQSPNAVTNGGNVYAWITPLALLFVLIEVGVEYYYKKGYISFPEAITNFGTAIGNQTMNVLLAVGVYHIYGFLHDSYAPFSIELNVYTFILLLLGLDFIFYWVHRWGHEINILWAAHSPHHSAEEMNFCVALRASVTQRLVSFLFFWPLTLIGFKPMDIYMMSAIHLFISFLHHTEYVRKLGFIELIFTTPSHHRVHHGVNFKYLDKNYGEFLIIWDKLFGSFAPETEKVLYGMYSPPRSWNPITINFHYFTILWREAVAAPRWIDKVKIWFMPLSWRPEGLPPKPPLVEITAQTQIRFSTEMFAMAKPYLIAHLGIGLGLMMMVIQQNSPWTITERWIGAGLLWFMIINWAGILEKSSWTKWAESIRLLLTAALVVAFADLYKNIHFLGVIIGLTVASLVWVWRYFRV